MRLALCLLLLAVLVGCGPAPAAQKRVRKPPAAPAVTATVRLPGDDGRVHIIDIAGRFDVSRCLVHVGPTTSSITCLPATDSAPTEWEPERP